MMLPPIGSANDVPPARPSGRIRSKATRRFRPALGALEHLERRALLAAPSLSIIDGGTAIAQGGTDPFGSTLACVPLVKTLYVKNTGTGPVDVANVFHTPTGFFVSSAYDTQTLEPGAQAAFRLQLRSATPGAYGGTVSFAAGPAGGSDSLFSFQVKGTVGVSPIVQYADDSGPGFAPTGGPWVSGIGPGFLGNQSTYTGPPSAAGAATWTLNVAPGLYQVSATWPAKPGQATNAKFSVLDGSDVVSTTVVDQRLSTAGFAGSNIPDARWEDLGGPVAISGHELVVRLSTQANGPVVADGIRIQRVSSLVFRGQGPQSSAQFKDLSGVPNPGLPYVGAVQAVVPDPNDVNKMWIATVNGGIWYTGNATAPSPTWVPQTDMAGSLSMADLTLDPTDPSGQTLVAAVGRTSSYGTAGGNLTGLLKTTDGGTTWLPIGQNALQGLTVRSVAARGNAIVVAAVSTDVFSYGEKAGGVFVSDDGGATFERASGIDAENAYSVVGVPGATKAGDPNAKRLFASTSSGIYTSDNNGESWSPIDGNLPEIPEDLTQIRLAVSRPAPGKTPVLYAGFVADDVVTELYRSADLGKSWTPVGLPLDDAGQGEFHFSLLVAPNDPNVVYMGLKGVNVYRGVYSPKTGRASWTQIGAGGTNTSGPNDDSRNLAVDAQGNLIEVDDGGIYRRTKPMSNAGAWSSLTGTLADAELHNVAYDPSNGTILGGAQDDGNPGSLNPGGTAWADQSVVGADGGQVQVSPAGVRYTSAQNLANFTRRLHFGQATEVPLEVVGPNGRRTGLGLSDFVKLPRIKDALPFVTPFRLNAIDPNWLIIGGGKYLYESRNGGQTVRVVGRRSFGQTTALAYGGRMPLARDPKVSRKDPGLLYVGTDNPKSFLLLRLSATQPLRAVASYPGSSPRQVVLDPNNGRVAFVVDNANRVWRTTDAGAPGSWTDLTGNLADPSLGTLAYIPEPNASGGYALLAGGVDSVYRMLGTQPGVWGVLGSGLPKVPVFELAYSSASQADTLVAGTLGRGAWTIGGIAANPDLFRGAPTLSPIAPQGVAAGAPSPTIGFQVGSPSTAPGDLVVTAVSSNPDLVPNADITLGGTGANRTIRFRPVADATGSGTITVTVSDGTASSFRTFPIVVAPVAPGLSLFPMLSQSIEQGTSTAPNPFLLAHASDSSGVTYSAVSSNPGLVPNANIAVDPFARTVTVTPAAGQSGEATITLTARQGGQSATTTFDVTVNPIPEPPAIAPIPDQHRRVGTGPVNVPLSIALPPEGTTGKLISDSPDDSREFPFDNVTLYVQSSNPGLLPVGNVTIARNGDGAFTLTARPVAGQVGVTTVTVGADNGEFTVTSTFKVTITRGGRPSLPRVLVSQATPAGPRGLRFRSPG